MTTKMPAGLGAAGKRLWRSLTDKYELDPHELVLLEAAARQSDNLADCERHLAESDVMVLGSTGQPRVNPLVPEIRQQRIALAKLIDALALPTEDAAPVSAASRRARKAAQTRWGRVEALRQRREASLGEVS